LFLSSAISNKAAQELVAEQTTVRVPTGLPRMDACTCSMKPAAHPDEDRMPCEVLRPRSPGGLGCVIVPFNGGAQQRGSLVLADALPPSVTAPPDVAWRSRSPKLQLLLAGFAALH
jgi:hypothetical protein